MKTQNIFLFFVISSFFVFVESIAGGSYTTILDAPFYISSITHYFKNVICGGVILSENWILTAGHCASHSGNGSKDLRIGASTNSTNTSIYQVESVLVYGSHESGNVPKGDIALFKLKTPLTFSEYVQPIQISSVSPKAGDKLTVFGMGRRNEILRTSPTLKKTTLTVLSQRKCVKSLPNPELFENSTFCASDSFSQTCTGDSGGPAVMNGKLYGIVSFGKSNCWDWDGRRYEVPTYFVDVPKFYDWIMKNIEIDTSGGE